MVCITNSSIKAHKKTDIPVVATILSKSIISEDHPSYLGLYEGAMGYEWVRVCRI
jgi:indolepyruvate decarboxylase